MIKFIYSLACKTEMREHQCVGNPQDPNKQLSLINLLLCLEKRIKTGNIFIENNLFLSDQNKNNHRQSNKR